MEYHQGKLGPENQQAALRLNLPARFETAVNSSAVLLPDGRMAKIGPENVAYSTEEDVWCDDFELIIKPEYEQLYACILETIVNAGHCETSGSYRFLFVLQNLSLSRAKGDFFDCNRVFIDRRAEVTDWLKERTFCDAFTALPRRCMNRLKERIGKPRQGILDVSEDDHLILRLCYISLAVRVFLARAGYPEFCARREPDN